MKKIYLILIFIVGVLVLVNIAIQFIPKKSTQVQDSCVYLTGGEKENCYTNTALDLKDATICEKIQDKNIKELCYSSLAIYLNNYTICEKIQEYNLKNQCLATSKNDTSFCEKIQDQNIKVYPCV